MATTVHPLYIGPGWFFGVDNIVNIFSILVCLLIFLFGYKVYRLTLNNNYKVFSYAFLLVCLSYIFKVGTLAALYFATNNITPLEGVPAVGAVTTSVTAAMTINQIVFIGSLWTMLAFLLGLLFLLTVALRVKQRRLLGLLAIFILITARASIDGPYRFYLAGATMLAIICLYFYENWQRRKTRSSFIVLASFSAIFASQILFALQWFHNAFYALGGIVQLLGFLGLLVNYIMVLRK